MGVLSSLQLGSVCVTRLAVRFRCLHNLVVPFVAPDELPAPLLRPSGSQRRAEGANVILLGARGPEFADRGSRSECGEVQVRRVHVPRPDRATGERAASSRAIVCSG